MSQRTVNSRIRLLGTVLALVFAIALGRAVWLETVDAGLLSSRADAQHIENTTIPGDRGVIFDRTGVELAQGVNSITVTADPKVVRDQGSPLREARKAAFYLGMTGAQEVQLEEALSSRTSRFVYVERQAPAAMARRLERLHLKGFYFSSEQRRFYPQGSLAAQLLGFSNIDGKGIAGLELAYNKELTGRPGHQTAIRDPEGQVVQILHSTSERPGANLTLTLDNAIQQDVEGVLRQTLKTWQARSATATVLDAHTGAVLAMATMPGYNANAVGRVAPSLWRNRPFTDVYEPGSTFKLVTIAGALADGKVTPSRTFNLPYSIEVAPHTRPIHDAELRGTETMSVSQILSHSSNVGAITISRLLGAERLASWIKLFGFGKTTGIDFPGESSGRVPPVDQWYGTIAGTIPIGQGVSVTPLQLAAAYAAIANGGVWVQPHLAVRAGEELVPKPKRHRVVSPSVAAQVLTMLREVVDEGTGQLAGISGYSIAGKTGTAQIPDPKTGKYSDKYMASFVGIVPANKPRLVILVTVEAPSTIWGGTVAAPAFRQIALDCLSRLEVPPDTAN